MINSAGYFRLLERTQEPTWTSAFRMAESVNESGEDEKKRKSDAK